MRLGGAARRADPPAWIHHFLEASQRCGAERLQLACSGRSRTLNRGRHVRDPQRPRLDEFTATSAADETGSDERGVLLASASMTRQVVLPTPQPLAFLRGTRSSYTPQHRNWLRYAAFCQAHGRRRSGDRSTRRVDHHCDPRDSRRCRRWPRTTPCSPLTTSPVPLMTLSQSHRKGQASQVKRPSLQNATKVCAHQADARGAARTRPIRLPAGSRKIAMTTRPASVSRHLHVPAEREHLL